MSFDFKLGMIYYGLSFTILIVIALAALVRFIINRSFAIDGHAFYLEATQNEPQCYSCPFSKRCPYAGGVTCKFGKSGGKSV